MFDFIASMALEVQQFRCLSQAIYFEARGESFAGQVYVGYVIKNRVRSPRFPNTYCDVINQPYQFSFVHQIENLVMKDTPSRILASQIAYMVMSSPSPISQNVMYYHTTHISPKWDYTKLSEYGTLGNHQFYASK